MGKDDLCFGTIPADLEDLLPEDLNDLDEDVRYDDFDCDDEMPDAESGEISSGPAAPLAEVAAVAPAQALVSVDNGGSDVAALEAKLAESDAQVAVLRAEVAVAAAKQKQAELKADKLELAMTDIAHKSHFDVSFLCAEDGHHGGQP